MNGKGASRDVQILLVGEGMYVQLSLDLTDFY